MEGHTIDHSDSDSGESWTILESFQQNTEDVCNFSRSPSERIICCEKDEDTDGISIISDSDHENTVLLKSIDLANLNDANVTKDNEMQSYITVTPQETCLDDNVNMEESLEDSNDILMDTNEKLKTYVHRRNKRLSTILNIIMLGSVITAAGVAIGHMWAKNDCTMHQAPSVNKILSNLYKLQEENAFLRNKLKEITLYNISQKQQHKTLHKQERCKKVFEEPLYSKGVSKITKCVDGNNIHNKRALDSHLVKPSFEKEFLSDVNKLRHVYEQNKHWLDIEISNRLKHEEQNFKNIKKSEPLVKQTPTIDDSKTLKIGRQNLPLVEEIDIVIEPHVENDSATKPQDTKQYQSKTVNIYSYADVVKSEEKNDIKKQGTENKFQSEYNDTVSKKSKKRNIEKSPEIVMSEEEIKKDDRQKCHKCKKNKKYDKGYRKQKGINAYQFNIKEQLDILKETYNTDQTQANIVEEIKNSDETRNFKQSTKKDKSNNENKPTWYEKRASFRKNSRKKLELELFGENSFNDSGWYFRRMKRREQCRAKTTNNSTHKKTSKPNKNFKAKY